MDYLEKMVGLFGFGHKQDDDLVDQGNDTNAAQDQWTAPPAQQLHAPVPSIDGVLPAAQSTQPAPPLPRPQPQEQASEPAFAGVESNDAGDYIMTDPATAQKADTEPSEGHRIEPAYEENSNTPSYETASQAPDIPEPSVETQSVEVVSEDPEPVAEPAVEAVEEPAVEAPVPEPVPVQEQEAPVVQNTPVNVEESTDDLSDIKQMALMDLTPLVDRLDQTPEEKFHTIMMLLQNTDRLSLIRTAYEAAQQIQDETARAEALLDVVHEINYFNQKQEQEEK